MTGRESRLCPKDHTVRAGFARESKGQDVVYKEMEANMKNIIGGMVCLLVALSPAWGADNSVEAKNSMLSEIGFHAQKVQQDAEHVSQHLKSKQVDPQFLKDKIGATADDMDKLQQLVSDFESRNFGLAEWQKKDWEFLKTKVQLLSIFYDRKKELVLADDVAKNKSLLRAHADGLAIRAAKLQSTASRLQK